MAWEGRRPGAPSLGILVMGIVRRVKERAKEFVIAFNRANPGRYGDLSLDAPLYSEGRMTLGDAIASDAFHF